MGIATAVLFERQGHKHSVSKWSDKIISIDMIYDDRGDYSSEIIAVSHNNNIIYHNCHCTIEPRDVDGLFKINVDDDGCHPPTECTLNYNNEFLYKFSGEDCCYECNVYVINNYVILSSQSNINAILSIKY
jgi:hypothetical protein